MANRMRRLVDPRAWSARERRPADGADDGNGESAAPLAVVARAATTQAEATEIYVEAAGGMPDPESRAAVESAASARRVLAARLAQELGRGGAAALAHADPPLARARPFGSIVRGADAWESALAVHLVTSVLDDATRLAAARMTADAGPRLRAVLAPAVDESELRATVTRAVAADARLAARLSLWGRRLAGDALLFARDSTALDATQPPPSAPDVDTADLISAHARRMDGLGLTA